MAVPNIVLMDRTVAIEASNWPMMTMIATTKNRRRRMITMLVAASGPMPMFFSDLLANLVTIR